MYQYTEEQTVSMKKVEATRASRFGADIRRMTAEEKDEVLASFHPDYIASAYEELKVGPNKGGKVLHELAALLEGPPRVLVSRSIFRSRLRRGRPYHRRRRRGSLRRD